MWDTIDEGPQMQVSTQFFEHLLNCLANQKFIHDVNADGMAEGPETVNAVQAANQAAIDAAYRHGHELLSQAVKAQEMTVDNG